VPFTRDRLDSTPVVVGFINKPFHPDKLLNHIRMLLKS